MKIALVGTGVSNLASIGTALKSLRVEPVVVNESRSLEAFGGVIIPGVGNFHHVMSGFRLQGFDRAIQDFAKSGRPILGICLGMQLLATSSNESPQGEPCSGLDLVPSRVVRLAESGCNRRLPHIGWNNHVQIEESSRLMRGVENLQDFYFVHSFHLVPDRPTDSVATCEYGVNFVSVIEADNVFGTQFHPEKSSRAGMKVLSNFVDIARC